MLGPGWMDCLGHRPRSHINDSYGAERDVTKICRLSPRSSGPSLRPPHPLFHFGMTGAFSIKGEERHKFVKFKVGEEWPPKFTKLELQVTNSRDSSPARHCLGPTRRASPTAWNHTDRHKNARRSVDRRKTAACSSSSSSRSRGLRLVGPCRSPRTSPWITPGYLSELRPGASAGAKSCTSSRLVGGSDTGQARVGVPWVCNPGTRPQGN